MLLHYRNLGESSITQWEEIAFLKSSFGRILIRLALSHTFSARFRYITYRSVALYQTLVKWSIKELFFKSLYFVWDIRKSNTVLPFVLFSTMRKTYQLKTDIVLKYKIKLTDLMIIWETRVTKQTECSFFIKCLTLFCEHLNQ